MKKDYRRTKTTVSMINYHFVFCPRYRRKLFLVDGIDTETLKYDIKALKAAFPAFLEMHENTKHRLQAVGSSLPASIGF